MTRFLILRPDIPFGRGTRGANLHRFLRVYHGRGAVEIQDVADLATGPRRRADVVFIGVPTRLTAHDLDRLDFRRAVLFDYGDVAGPQWQTSDEPLLRSLTNVYLKPWVEEDWDFGLRWGVLPIRRYPGLTWHVKVLTSLAGKRYPDILRRDHDVSFLGYATSYVGTASEPPYPQRVEWLSELSQARERFSFWGGLQASARDRATLSERHGDVTALYYPGRRIMYSVFFHHLLRSKAVLTPTGNARWTYRHYEAAYAGAILVSTDLRRVETLIPLPRDGMVHVPDHGSVVPAVDAALELRAQHPELPRQNLEFLERYLTDGDYSRSKPPLMQKFLAQLA